MTTARSLLLLLCSATITPAAPRTLTPTHGAIATAVSLIGSGAAYKTFKKAATNYESDKANLEKKEAYARAKRNFRILSLITAIAATGTTALFIANDTQSPTQTGTPKPNVSLISCFKNAHNVAELKQILHETTYDELTTALSKSNNSAKLTTQANTSYVEKLVLKDGSTWFLKVARRPGHINTFPNTHYRYIFGQKQNRSRYDMGQKIKGLRIEGIQAPEKMLLPLKHASANEASWTDTESVVLSPDIPTGSTIAPPSLQRGNRAEREKFIAQVKEYVTRNPSLLDALTRVVEKIDFADSHFGNIALLPNDKGLMIYDTEDVLQGGEEEGLTQKSEALLTEARERRKLWSLSNLIGRNREQPGISQLDLDADHPFQPKLQELKARKKKQEQKWLTALAAIKPRTTP